jgi:DNA sulfur modification protein DndB
MSTIVPVLRAHMGSRDYYITKMSAFEISGQVSIASELSDWTELTLNELYQRNLNEKRVEQDIAPYLANTKDRFFGSIIVWMLDEEVAEFEPVSDHVSVKAAYRSAAESMGFLTIDHTRGRGEGGLVAIDGQHRLAALRRVVQRQTEGEFASEVTSDEVAVIFVRDKTVNSARDLFTVLNRSARRVSKNDVLIMSEVDGAAIIARELTSLPLLAPHGLDDNPLVKWDKNTISAKDQQLTTLNALYEISQLVADHMGVDLLAGEEAGNPPSDEILAKVKKEAILWLSSLFNNSTFFENLRQNPIDIPDARRESEYSMLLKPAGLIAFFGAVVVALDQNCGKMKNIDEVMRQLLRVDWSMSSGFWRGIMVNAKGNITNKKSDIALASDLAAWMAAGTSSAAPFQQDLIERYRRQLGRVDTSLPTPLEDK